jgi:hypothetical protein
MGLAKLGKTRRLTGLWPGLDHQEAAGLVFGWVWNETEPFFLPKTGLLAGYPALLLTLHIVDDLNHCRWL